MRVAHVITGLDLGGAELALYRLLAHGGMHSAVSVISLGEDGPVGKRIAALGVPVTAARLYAGGGLWSGLHHLVRSLKETRPDIVMTWMYHANLIGGIAARFAGLRRIVWNIRASNLPAGSVKRTTRIIVQLGAWISRYLPKKIVCVSHSAAQVHSTLGYEIEKLIVIPNGFDTSDLAPNPQARRSVRGELGLPTSAPLVGLIARFDPIKNHEGFVRAAKSLALTNPDTHFLLVGDGVDCRNARLMQWLRRDNILERFHLLGRRVDIPRVTAALDVAASSSDGEGFPNTIAEAMSCGVPCVVTDVGESAQIVGDTGIIVPAGSSETLAAGLRTLLDLPFAEREALGLRARERIVANFGMARMVSRYDQLYEDVAL